MAKAPPDQFFTHIGHELRTPLTVLKSFSQLLSQQTAKSSDEKLQRYAHRLEESTDKLTRMVNATVDALRLEMGTYSSHHEELHIHSVAQVVMGSFSSSQQERVTLASEETLIVCSDRRLLNELIQAFLVVGLSLREQEQHISLQFQKNEKQLHLTVTYSCVCVSSEQKDLLQRVSTAQSVPDDVLERLGIELYLVARILVFLLGSVEIMETEDGDQIFQIKLPLLLDPC